MIQKKFIFILRIDDNASILKIELKGKNLIPGIF